MSRTEVIRKGELPWRRLRGVHFTWGILVISVEIGLKSGRLDLKSTSSTSD